MSHPGEARGGAEPERALAHATQLDCRDPRAVSSHARRDQARCPFAGCAGGRGSGALKIVAGILVLAIGAPCGATTVAILLRREALCVAADSRMRNMAERGDSIVTDDACKIEQLGELFFVTTGAAGIRDVPGQPDVDVRALIRSALRADVDMARNADEAARAVEEALQSAVPRALDRIPGAREELAAQGPIVSLAVVGRHGGDPSAEVRHIFAREKDGKLVVRTEASRPYTLPADPAVTVVEILGYHSAAAQFLSDRKNELATVPAVQVVETLVEVEAKRVPGWVGGPIDILELTPSSTKWVRRKPRCGSAP